MDYEDPSIVRLRQEGLGHLFRAREKGPIVLVVGAVQLGGSPPMTLFTIDGIAEQPVSVGHDRSSSLLPADRCSRISLESLDAIGQAQHECRGDHLVSETHMRQRPKPCSRRPLLGGLPGAGFGVDGPPLALGRRDDPEGIVLPTLRRLQAFPKLSQESREVHGGPIERERVREPVVVANVRCGLLPRLDEQVLLAKHLPAGLKPLGDHESAPSTSTSSAITRSWPSSTPVRTIGSKSGLMGSRVIFSCRQESPAAAFALR